jgi:tRNA dimethylallyltransferase
MLAAGAKEEALALETGGASRTARAALGFEEVLRDDAPAMKVAHRRYGRRQMTWLRKMDGLETVERDGLSDAEVAARVAAIGGRG